MVTLEATILLQILVNGLLLGSLYALLSVSLNLLAGVFKIINFAHGELLMLGMYAVYWFRTLWNIYPMHGAFLTSLLFLPLGFFLFKGVFKPLLSKPHLNQLIITIALSICLQGIAQLLWKTDFKVIRFEVGRIEVYGASVSILYLVILTIALLSSLLLWFFLMRTHIGIKIRAVAQDAIMSELMGIKTEKIYVLNMLISFLLAGLAGGLLICIFPAHPAVGVEFGLFAWVIIVIGGMGSVIGALLGGLLLGFIYVAASYIWSAELSLAIIFAFFIATLLFKPRGLFGAKARV